MNENTVKDVAAWIVIGAALYWLWRRLSGKGRCGCASEKPAAGGGSKPATYAPVGVPKPSGCSLLPMSFRR